MESKLFLMYFIYAAIAWVSFHFIITAFKRSKFNSKRLPPGPFPLPIVGNIFSLGTEPFEAFAILAKSYGPVATIQLGSQTTIVVSSASMAKEVLQTKDVSFANRHVLEALTALDHHEFSVAMRPADDRWKVYRKICISHVFANNRLDATQDLRKKKIQDLLSYIKTSSQTRKSVNICHAAFTISLNLLSNTFFSIDLADPSSEIAREYKTLVRNLTEELAIPNLADAFFILKPLDPQRIKKRTTAIFNSIFSLFDKMINNRLEERESTKSASGKNDVLDALLTLAQETEELSLPEVRHLMLDLFLAGTETTSTSLEWAMAELMHNPDKMKKTQSELEEVIGKGHLVEEKDSARLPYLQAVIKETLRLHPTLPFLLPRKVCEDITLGDFIVPKNAQILVNVNAIHKDASLWKNPELFDPERFLGSSVDFKGQSFEFFPFGSGRRICPGLPLANRMMHWMLGSLIHTFDWKLEDGVTSETLDMKEKVGFTLNKAESLCVIPISKE